MELQLRIEQTYRLRRLPCSSTLISSIQRSGPVKFLSSRSQPTLGQPSGSVENGGSVYLPSQAISVQAISQTPKVLQ